MARLRLATGEEAFELTESTITVGRETVNTIAISDPGISKHHALLIRDGKEYKLFDLHSANGTWVNEERITVAKLKGGDAVRFGPIALHYETAEKAAPASPNRPRFAPPEQLPAMSGSEASVSNPKKLASPSEQPVIAPKKLAQTGSQPTIAPKKLASESSPEKPNIRLKRD